jgi:hypothetical protein
MLFAAIFITMIPVLAMLKRPRDRSRLFSASYRRRTASRSVPPISG